jgi:hypothetical protein
MTNLIKRIAFFLIICAMLSLPIWAQEIPLTSDSYDHWCPQWSPDGNWIVYTKWDATGYGQIYKIASAGVEEVGGQSTHGTFHVLPNPFISFARIPGYEQEYFTLYDIAGKAVGKCKGDGIGWDLPAGIYFVVPEKQSMGMSPLRVIKIK